jgi:hypothetical protein
MESQRGREMFLFFPFALESSTAPVSQRVPQYKPLPFLPQPQSARAQVQPENGLASAVSSAGNLAVDLLKKALSSIASSMTALGNRANALFSQVAAALAFDRMARQAASLFEMFWPGFALPKPQMGFAGPWTAPALQQPLFAGFGLPGFQASPTPLNPWGAVTEALDMWTNIWAPAKAPQRRSTYGTAAPVTTTFAFPGFAWSLTLG